MKAQFYFMIFFLVSSPFQGDALSCCFVDLFCSKSCLTEGFLTAGNPRILNRGLRSVFAFRSAHDLEPEGQSDLLSRVRRNIHIQKFARRLFAPTHLMSTSQDFGGTRKLVSRILFHFFIFVLFCHLFS